MAGHVPGWAILAGLLALCLIALELGVLRPLSRLTRWLEKYQAGDRSARVPVESARGVIAPLGQGFNRLADQVTELETRLTRHLETRAEFISLVSHELRTPLTAIGGYVKLLRAGDAGPINETQREFLSIVDVNVDRLTRLVSDILDVEKMESGRVQLKRDVHDLRAVLRECHATFVELARKKGLELAFDAGAGPAPVSGDRGRLVQVFMNLISNAVKYTERGKVTLELEPREFAVVARVRDTGPGMKPEELQKLFQKFYRTRSGLSSTQVGTGLGLFLADRLVRAHGGSISVESAPGQGTVFEVTLPAASATAPIAAPATSVSSSERRAERDGVFSAAPAPEAAPAEAAPQELLIWIFDPEQAEVERMTSILEASAPSGGRRLRARAFARVEDAEVDDHPEGRPELIVFDPQAASYDLAAITRLRAGLRGTVPVLVVSGSIDTAVAFAEGASAMLTKPIDDREFLIAIRELLQAKPRRVLLADRNPDLRLLLKRELEQQGVHVDDVERGNLVMGRLDAEEYDLALLDAQLPDVSGLELLRVIRKRERLEGLPVLLMTRDDQGVPARAELARSGASDVVDKRQGIGGIIAQIMRHLG